MRKLFSLFNFSFLLFNFSFAQDSMQVIPLWKNGAPGFEKLKNEPEMAKDWWVRNINNPSLTVFPAPKEIANGTAVVCYLRITI